MVTAVTLMINLDPLPLLKTIGSQTAHAEPAKLNEMKNVDDHSLVNVKIVIYATKSI